MPKRQPQNRSLYEGAQWAAVEWKRKHENTRSRTAKITKSRSSLWAGGAGMSCARKLASNPAVEITLIDKNNYQQFQPLLYQVATGLLAPSNAAFSLRSILHHC